MTEAIARFNSRTVPAATWVRIGPVVRSSVEATVPDTVYSARELMTLTTKLVMWADVLGQPLVPAVLFAPHFIDRFVKEGCETDAPGTQLNTRTKLRRVAAAVLGEAVYPPRPLPFQRSPIVEPYTEKEQAEWMSWARGLSTSHRRRNALALVAPGFGAGLSSQEINRLTGDDITSDHLGVVVHVLGTRSRDVAVLRRWEETLVSLAEESGPRPLFLPERTKITRAQVPSFIERARAAHRSIDTRRVRASWIVTHLKAETPIKVLERAAGVDASQLVKYLSFVDAPDSEYAYRLLREAGS